jgi:hypothetical protein
MTDSSEPTVLTLTSGDHGGREALGRIRYPSKVTLFPDPLIFVSKLLAIILLFCGVMNSNVFFLFALHSVTVCQLTIESSFSKGRLTRLCTDTLSQYRYLDI